MALTTIGIGATVTLYNVKTVVYNSLAPEQDQVICREVTGVPYTVQAHVPVATHIPSPAPVKELFSIQLAQVIQRNHCAQSMMKSLAFLEPLPAVCQSNTTASTLLVNVIVMESLQVTMKMLPILELRVVCMVLLSTSSDDNYR